MFPHPSSPLRSIFSSRNPSKVPRSPHSPKLGFTTSSIPSPPHPRPKTYHHLGDHPTPNPITARENAFLGQRSFSVPVSTSLPSNLNLLSLSTSNSVLIETGGQSTPKGILISETPPPSPLRVKFASFLPFSTRPPSGFESPLMKRVLTPMPRSYQAYSPTSIATSYSMPRLYSGEEPSGYGSIPPHPKLRKPRRDLPSPISTSRSTTVGSDCTLTSLDRTERSLSVASENESLEASSILAHPPSLADAFAETYGLSTAHDLNPASLTRRLGKLLVETRTPSVSPPVSPTSPIQNRYAIINQRGPIGLAERHRFEHTAGSLSCERSHMQRAWSSNSVDTVSASGTESEYDPSKSTTASVLAVEGPAVPVNSPIPPSLGCSGSSGGTSSSSFARWDYKASFDSSSVSDCETDGACRAGKGDLSRGGR
ncbi:hypothetical protein BKA70DRAFT_1437963 [Coprinopsis sp. MPI-PUGE-AT-0042]|nr:hypothetical protein BKA70DRAFT_1437963 [Coprinopsis sp. MPI-PUGE-AT-0042]